MKIDTPCLGVIQVPEEAIIRFPHGLYGFEGAHAYCLIPYPFSLGNKEREAKQAPAPWGSPTFYWLQAVDLPKIAMIVTDPFPFFPAYEVEICDSAAELLQAASAAEIAIYTTITVAREQGCLYANLLGPLAVNHRARLGMQLVQDATRYTTRHQIEDRLPSSVEKDSPRC